MSIASVTIAFCAALPSTVTVAFGSKLVPLMMNVVPSEHSGLGTIDVIVGGGEFFLSEQPMVASSKQPSTAKPVDGRMVTGRVQPPYLRGALDLRELDRDGACTCTRSYVRLYEAVRADRHGGCTNPYIAGAPNRASCLARRG